MSNMHSFVSCLGKKLILVPMVIATLFLATSTISSLPVSAATLGDPAVAVVRDITATSNCMMGSTHTRPSSCPAGTILEEFTVPRSIAAANHEAFVPLPAKNASAAQVEAFLSQLEALKTSVLTSFHKQTPAITHPLTSCGSNGSFWVDFRHNQWEIYGEVEVDRYNYCNLNVNNSIVQGVNIAGAWYWAKDQYAGAIWHHGCTFIGNTIYNWPPEKVVNGGYDWEQVFYNNAGCGSANGEIWDNMGPLS